MIFETLSASPNPSERTQLSAIGITYRTQTSFRSSDFKTSREFSFENRVGNGRTYQKTNSHTNKQP